MSSTCVTFTCDRSSLATRRGPIALPLKPQSSFLELVPRLVELARGYRTAQ